MGKVQLFEIALDKNKDVYSPGESISGTVTIKVGQALPCKGIKVNCHGFCGITTKVNDTSWTSEEQYFNSSISVVDKGTLKQGVHTFPFKFLIPATAPTSFEGNYGRIIYRVRAFLDTPRFSKDYSAEKPFYLLRLLNLNEIPDIWGVCESEVSQEFTYMLVKSGTVVLKAQTDMKGYTSGQVIKVTAHVHNDSGKTTGNISASLMQRVTYETKKPTHDIKVIAEVEGGVVKRGKELDWKEQIIVPALPQSCLTGCELIKIEYYIKVSLKSPDVMLTLPIQIGNVSLDKKHQPSKKATSPPTAEEPAASAVAPDASMADGSTPQLPPRPAPKPAPRSRVSSYIPPSAPPAEYAPEPHNDKRQSQLVSPNAFSYAPGLLFPHTQQPGPSAPAGPAFVGPNPAATVLYPSISGVVPVPSPQGPPPNYSASDYPQEAPPPYHDSYDT
ncbi:arrestin domain-containing protein 1a [Gouania willdenowi]|uniref:Arrestin domain-containing protein 1-like n=1 Tax=Gouania willdenowi TaxID=441366 RepID=A0A8C5I6I0_GOUWI|nr:arrestin domain-containing protein 1-like [Gouania willdenowi]